MSKRILTLCALVAVLLGSGLLLQERRRALEADLRLEAVRQLSLERVMGVNPEFDGRDVTLGGKVVSESEKARAEAVVRAIEGVGTVTNALAVGPRHVAVPLRYFLDVAWKSEGVNVKGRVPDEGTKALLLERAAEGFGPELVVDRLEVDGSLGPGDWLLRIAPLVPELTGAVTPGRMKAAGGKVVLAGFVASEESRLLLEEAARQRLPGFEVESHLRVEPPVDDSGGTSGDG